MPSIHGGLCGSLFVPRMYQKRAAIQKNRCESVCYGKLMAEREGFPFTSMILKILVFSRFLLHSLLHSYNYDL